MTQSPSPAADRISPPNSDNADVHVSSTADGSPAPRNAAACSARRSTSSASTARVDLQRVTGTRPRHERGVAERPAQPGHLRLEHVACRADGLVSPEVLDQALGADHHAGLEGETNQHLGRLATPDGDALIVAVQLDDIEH